MCCVGRKKVTGKKVTIKFFHIYYSPKSQSVYNYFCYLNLNTESLILDNNGICHITESQSITWRRFSLSLHIIYIFCRFRKKDQAHCSRYKGLNCSQIYSSPYISCGSQMSSPVSFNSNFFILLLIFFVRYMHKKYATEPETTNN